MDAFDRSMSRSSLSLLVRVSQIAAAFRENVAPNLHRVGIFLHPESHSRYCTDECRLEMNKVEMQGMRGK